MGSSNTTYGIRVESGSNSGSDVLGFGGFFNHSNSFVTYSNEIQLVNGYFQTMSSSTDGYINYGNTNSFYNPLGGYTYPNYTSISSGQYRYLTVLYYINVTSQS